MELVVTCYSSLRKLIQFPQYTGPRQVHSLEHKKYSICGVFCQYYLNHPNMWEYALPLLVSTGRCDSSSEEEFDQPFYLPNNSHLELLMSKRLWIDLVSNHHEENTLISSFSLLQHWILAFASPLIFILLLMCLNSYKWEPLVIWLYIPSTEGLAHSRYFIVKWLNEQIQIFWFVSFK
jgi:hypothetical protein